VHPAGHDGSHDFDFDFGTWKTHCFSIWDVTAEEARSEQAFSADGGKTWEVNWITQYTRVSP
jgi:hypothetical protein